MGDRSAPRGTKRPLGTCGVTPLYSPKRRPQYNGGVERANALVAGYQKAVAEFYSRRAGPTCEDAETARRWANDLSRPRGWRGPAAGQLWAERERVSAAERSAFQAAVQEHRAEVRGEWEFAADESLAHDPAAAIDRRAVRDALVQHGLLAIHPRHRKRGFRDQNPASLLATQAPGAGILQLAMHAAPPTVGGAQDLRPDVLAWGHPLYEEANYSTNNSPASGQD